MSRRPYQSRPTQRMGRLFLQLREQWGDPADLFVYEPRDMGYRAHVPLVHVLAWSPTEQRKTTFLATLGMSDQALPQSELRVELRLIHRGQLSVAQRQDLSKLLIQIVRYPFEQQRSLDYWEVIDVGAIPVFQGCRHVLLSSKVTKQGVDAIEDEGGEIKILHVVPITPSEKALLVSGGQKAFLEYVRSNKVDLLSDRNDDDLPTPSRPNPSKTFQLTPDKIRGLTDIKGTGRASDAITVEGLPVGFMYREEPVSEGDSGWRFEAGDETDEYIDDPANSEVFDLNTIANYDPDIIAHLEAPVGAAFERDTGDDEFVEVDLDAEEEEDDDEEYDDDE